MTNREFENAKKRIEVQNKDAEQRLELKKLRNKYKKKVKLPATSKIVLLAVFLLCLQIVVFCEKFMWKFGDSSAMYSLIGVPVALMPVVISYYMKSKAENTSGGITYEMAMSQLNEQEYNNEDDPVG